MVKRGSKRAAPADKQRQNSGKAGRDAAGKFAPGNPHAFRPGESGNPAGRPKSITLSEALRRELAKEAPAEEDKPATGETYAEQIARAPRAAWVDLETGDAEPVGEWPDVDIEAIQLTAGDEPTREHRLTRVPKRDLVSTAQLALQSGRLKVSAGLEHAPTLQKELVNFKTKIKLGHSAEADTLTEWREGSHDDLVRTVCLALWTAQHGMRKHLVFA